jgi:tetratricopeptide (TPR) repeat protein
MRAQRGEAVARKKHHPESAAQTLDQIESRGDRIVEWVGNNPMILLGTAFAILLAAGALGLGFQSRDNARNESAAALSRVQALYRVAMGASPGSIDIPEPANPETAREVRTEYLAQFLAVADEHSGSAAAGLALLEAGRLQLALGEGDQALAMYDRALGELDDSNPVRALVLASQGAVHEVAGRWSEAGAAYETASNVANYPLRYEALSDSARCYAQAGEDSKAIQALDSIRIEAPNYRIPPYVEARINELKAGPAE